MSSNLIFDGYRPGVIGQLIELHMEYYTPNWNFGVPFETKLAREMGEFFARFDLDRDFFVAAYDGTNRLAGAVVLDGIGPGAHLRWFITSHIARGQGLGRQLMARAMEFLTDHYYETAWLTTFSGLDAARKLYEDFGFRLVVEEAADPWSGTVGKPGAVGLQRFEWHN